MTPQRWVRHANVELDGLTCVSCCLSPSIKMGLTSLIVLGILALCFVVGSTGNAYVIECYLL